MLTQILSRTPVWVFALLAVLIALGLLQMRTRSIALRRVIILPAVFLLLSLAGVVTAFGWVAVPLLAWAIGYIALLFAAKALTSNQNNRYDFATRTLKVAGSAVPLVLMMSIFALKFFVGASTAMRTSFAMSDLFPMVISLLYGGFSGIFAGRAFKLFQLTRIA